MLVRVPAYMYVHGVWGCVWRQKRALNPPAGVTDGSESPDAVGGHRMWAEQQVLLPQSQPCRTPDAGLVLF